jgi:hypothetical protein
MSGPSSSHSIHAGAGIPTLAGERTQRLLRGVNGLPMPHSLVAEKGVLCCMMNAPATVLPIVQQSISAEFLYLSRHQVLFNEMCTLYSDKGTFDSVTLMERLTGVGHLNSVGGPGYFNEVYLFRAIPENVSHYIDILKDKRALRSIIGASTESILKAYDAGQDSTGGPGAIFDELFVGLEQARTVLTSSLRLPKLCDITNFIGENQPEEPPELVQGILHQGSKLIVGGTSKGRKTMALIDLAVSVATGTPWWGFPCKQGQVCYINFEIQEAFFAQRVQAVCEAKGVTLQPGMFHVWNLRGHGEGIENIVDDLMAVLRHRAFVLIIIDPIYKALGDRDENKAGDVASMLNQLERIAVKTRAAVGFGAHYSKGNQSLKEAIDRIGGSGVFARDPDSILTMTAHEEEEAFTVDATLRNFAPIKPFVVKWGWPLFKRADDLDPERLKPARTGKSGRFEEKYSTDLLLDQLSVDDGLKPGEAVKRLKESENMSRDTVYRLRKKLIKQKLLVERDGLWFKGNGRDA